MAAATQARWDVLPCAKFVHKESKSWSKSLEEGGSPFSSFGNRRVWDPVPVEGYPLPCAQERQGFEAKSNVIGRLLLGWAEWQARFNGERQGWGEKGSGDMARATPQVPVRGWAA